MSDQVNPFYDAGKRASYLQFLAEGMSKINAAGRIGGTPYLLLVYLSDTKDSEFAEADDRAYLQGESLRGVVRGEA